MIMIFMTPAERLINDIQIHPEEHKHDLNGLIACCTIDRVVDLSVMQAHQDYVDLGRNGGIKCDVVQGPCACGGWH